MNVNEALEYLRLAVMDSHYQSCDTVRYESTLHRGMLHDCEANICQQRREALNLLERASMVPAPIARPLLADLVGETPEDNLTKPGDA